jgi:transcriptional regulator with XRE-family HTH domain
MFIDQETYTRLIPNALLKVRKLTGMSMEEVAAGTGINILTIQNYEEGKNLPWMPYLLSILEFCRLNLGQFHDILVDIHSNELCDETSNRIRNLEQRLSRLEEAAKSRTLVQ